MLVPSARFGEIFWPLGVGCGARLQQGHMGDGDRSPIQIPPSPCLVPNPPFWYPIPLSHTPSSPSGNPSLKRNHYSRVGACRAGNFLTPLLNLQVFPGMGQDGKYRKGTHPTPQKTSHVFLTSILWKWGRSQNLVKLPACSEGVPSAGNFCT